LETSQLTGAPTSLVLINHLPGLSPFSNCHRPTGQGVQPKKNQGQTAHVVLPDAAQARMRYLASLNMTGYAGCFWAVQGKASRPPDRFNGFKTTRILCRMDGAVKSF